MVRVFGGADAGGKIWREQRSVRAMRAASGRRVTGWKGQRSDGLVRLRPYIPLTPRRIMLPLLSGGRWRLSWVRIPRPSMISTPLFVIAMLALWVVYADDVAAAAATGATVPALEDAGAASALFWPWYLAIVSGLAVMALTRGWDRLGFINGGQLEPGMVVRVPGRRFTAGEVTATDRLGDLVDVELAGGHRFTVEAGRVFTALALR